MITDAALIQKMRARWQHYVVQARWKRADRVKRRLDRVEKRYQANQDQSQTLTA